MSRQRRPAAMADIARTTPIAENSISFEFIGKPAIVRDEPPLDSACTIREIASAPAAPQTAAVTTRTRIVEVCPLPEREERPDAEAARREAARPSGAVAAA